MSMANVQVVGTERNRLLQMLPATEYERLLSQTETVCLPVKTVLYEAGEPITHVYFPQSGVISLVNVMSDGGVVEVGTVGNEGMAGLPVFLGAASSPTKAFSQVEGSAKRIEAPAFRHAIDEREELRTVLQRYTQALMSQMAQSVACNRLHTVEERLARWLLMTHDRAGTDQLALTQEFLSDMLGVRRAGVTVAAGALQKAGLISYRRGKITVLDRLGLEEASCECYRIVKSHFDRLLAV